MIDYESEVKKVYADAKYEYASFGWGHVVAGDISLSDAYKSEWKAWVHAYETLLKQGKLKENERTES